MVEALLVQPLKIARRPTLLTRIDTTVLQHKGADLLAMDA
jgi:hypothetical protein